MPEAQAASSEVITDEVEISKLLQEQGVDIIKLVIPQPEEQKKPGGEVIMVENIVEVNLGTIMVFPQSRKICIRDKNGKPFQSVRFGDIRELHFLKWNSKSSIPYIGIELFLLFAVDSFY